MPITDYKALLVKYIRHVDGCEGVSFLRDGIDRDAGSFNEEEWSELQRLDEQSQTTSTSAEPVPHHCTFCGKVFGSEPEVEAHYADSQARGSHH